MKALFTCFVFILVSSTSANATSLAEDRDIFAENKTTTVKPKQIDPSNLPLVPWIYEYIDNPDIAIAKLKKICIELTKRDIDEETRSSIMALVESQIKTELNVPKLSKVEQWVQELTDIDEEESFY